MTDKEHRRKSLVIAYIFLFLLTDILCACASFIYGRSFDVILRNTVFSSVCAGILVFLLADAGSRRSFSYDNYDRPMRFILGYIASLIAAVVLPLVSWEIWPYLVIFVLLGLFSNETIGLYSGAMLCALSVLLENNGSPSEFMLYLIVGIVALSLIRELTEHTHIGLSLFICLTLQMVLVIAFGVLFSNKSLSPEMFVMPGVNLVICLMLLLLVLNMFGVYVIRGTKDRYMDVNDTEFPLLVELKEKNKDEYMRAIHTAYLAERIALDLKLNARAVKSMAYYHRIGIANGLKTWEEVEQLLEKNQFPEEGMGYLKEYIESKPGERRSKEYTVINMSETVIASVMYLFAKDNKAALNVDTLVDQIFANKMEDPAFHNNDISLYELERMKAIMKKERLYYDFLR